MEAIDQTRTDTWPQLAAYTLAVAAEDPIAKDLHEEQVLAACGLALGKIMLPGATPAILLQRRMTSDRTIPRTTQKTFYLLSVNGNLFNIKGPCDWDMVLQEHNHKQTEPAQWGTEPLDMGGKNFSDVFWSAGERSTGIFKLSDHLRSHIQSRMLDVNTDKHSVSPRTRRV